MKIETAARATERVKLQTAPVYFARFFHLKKYGDGVDYPFSVDFSTAAVASASKSKLQHLGRVRGGQSQIVPDQGRATIGGFTFLFTDVLGQFLKYLSAPALTLKTAMTAGVPAAGGFVDLNEATVGLPDVGTIEITTSGVIERVRYDLNDTANKRVRVATSGRGADGTTAAAHAINDPATNGEQIRPGQRVQLFAGYDALAETDYMSFVKMEVVDRRVDGSGLGFVIESADLQRTLRRQIFLAATALAPVTLTGNPIDLALQVLLSTGTGTNYSGIGTNYDVLAAGNGLGVPYQLVDVAGLEALRAAEFIGQTYHFSIISVQDGKTWLEKEIWQTLNCYPLVLQDGKLSAKRYKPAPAPGSVTEVLDSGDLVSAAWQAGDRLIINRVLVQYDFNKSTAPGDFSKRRLYTFDGSVTKYGPRPPLVITSAGFDSTEPSVEAWIDERAFMVGKRFADPPPLLQCTVFYRKHLWEVGDPIKITYDKLPNLGTGLRGFTNEVFEIVDIQPAFGAEGKLVLTLLHTGAITLPGVPSNGGTVVQPTPGDVTPPASPTGVTITTNSFDQFPSGPVLPFLVLGWTAVPDTDLAHYEVRYRIQGSATYQSVSVPKEQTGVKLTALKSSTVYELQARAVDANANVSAWAPATPVTATTVVDLPPAAPIGLGLTVSSEVTSDGTFLGIIEAAWTANTELDLAGYEIQWKPAADTIWSSTRLSGASTIRLRALKPNTLYDLRVAAFDGAGNLGSFAAQQATTPANPGNPAAPTGLAHLSLALSVALSWNQNAESDILKYQLERADDSGFLTNVKDWFLDVTAFLDETGDTTGRFYRVRAVRRSGPQSTWSAFNAGAAVAGAQVTDSQIASLAVAKLIAGDLSVAVRLVIGAIFRNATSGARFELDKDGYRLFNAGGAQIADLNSAGTFLLGTSSGARVAISQDSIEVFNASAISVLKIQNTTPFIRIGKVDGTELTLDSAGSLVKIITAQLADFAVNAAQQGNTNLDLTITTGFANDQTLSVTPASANSKIKISYQAELDATNSTTPELITFKIHRNIGGVTLTDVYTINVKSAGTVNTRSIVAFSWIDEPATTSVTTYNIQVAKNNATGTHIVRNRVMTLTEMKK